jgi:hypothetical protein
MGGTAAAGPWRAAPAKGNFQIERCSGKCLLLLCIMLSWDFKPYLQRKPQSIHNIGFGAIEINQSISCETKIVS